MTTIRAARWFLPVAAILLAGCAPLLEFSRTTRIAHSDPRPLAASDPRLVVKATPLPVGRVLLVVTAERTVGTEQEFWRESKGEWVIAGGAFEGGSRPDTPGPSGVYSPASSGTPGWFLCDSEIAAAIVVGLVGVVVACLVAYQVGSVFFALATWAIPFDEHRTIVRQATTQRESCASVVIEAAEGGERFELGPQPDGGYVLEPEILLRLGRPGAFVVIHAGGLSRAVELPR